MSGWHWFSKGGRASAGVSLTRRDGLRADLRVDDTTVDMQVAPSRNLSVGLTLDACGDDPVTGHVGVWPLPTVYLSADAPILRRLADVLAGDTGREIAMPERVYRVQVSRRDRVWTRPRWPGEWLRVRDVEIDVLDEGGIPVPGKGENSWDLDDDAVLSHSFPGVDVNTALRRFVCGIHETRIRHGGPAWVPSKREHKETDGG